MVLLRLLVFLFFFTSCKTPSIEQILGIQDPYFAKVKFDPSSTQTTFELLFRPNISSIPTGAQTNEYIVSFTILKSTTPGSDTFYNHVNAFLSFRNEGTLQEPIFRYMGLTTENCDAPCDNLFTGFQNEQGDDLTDDSSSTALLTRSQEDEYFHLRVFLDPVHVKESWRSIHGFPGNVAGIPQILYPYYRVDFIIQENK